jgi:hypothetical protein
MVPGSNRPWATAVRAVAESADDRARDAPGGVGPWDVPGEGGVLEARPRGAVPVGVAELSTAEPQPAQNRADAGTGSEHAGQGSVTGESYGRSPVSGRR